MPNIVPDLTDVVELAPGDYSVRIVDSKEWIASKGTGMIKWTLDVFDAADDRHNGAKLFYSTPYNGRGAFMLKKFIVAVTGEDVPANIETSDYHGSELRVKIEPGKNQNGDLTGFMDVRSVSRLSA